jgi:hypothetical protein
MGLLEARIEGKRMGYRGIEGGDIPGGGDNGGIDRGDRDGFVQAYIEGTGMR